MDKRERDRLVPRVGIDLCDPERIKKAVARHGARFLDRVFTPAEIESLSRLKNPYPSYAARFAAKEAVMKLLGRGMGSVAFTEIEITADPGGRPRVTLRGGARRLADSLGVGDVDVSLTHEKGMAAAAAFTVVRV
ncbi:MAG: holo-ACP synthase [Candidatus Nitrospinota bacterium M3_3B_026]